MLCGLAATGAASAHEFWVEPSAFAVEQGGRVGVRLCIGDAYEGWSQARNPARIEDFSATGPAGRQPVVGLDGADPAGALRPAAPGDYVIVYRSDRAFTEMPATEFDAYLRDKGLDAIIAARRTRIAPTRPVREAYSRNAKALIHAGPGPRVPSDRVMNLPLELIADTVGSGALSDGRRGFQLLNHGRPLAGALVSATRLGTADEMREARTDANGRVQFQLQPAGRWRIAAVHMRPAPRGLDADWVSWWASLTFELPAGESAGAPRPATACRNRVAA